MFRFIKELHMCGQAGARHLQNCPAGGRNMVDYRAVMGRSLDGAHWAPPCFLSCSPRTMSMLPLLIKHHFEYTNLFFCHIAAGALNIFEYLYGEELLQ